MQYTVGQVKTSISGWEQSLMDSLIRTLGIRPGDVAEAVSLRRSLDARRKPDLYYVHTVAVRFTRASVAKRLLKKGRIAPYAPHVYRPPEPGQESLSGPVVVVGAGPAGLFAAFALAEAGYRPLVIERGPDMAGRVRATERFWADGTLDPEANVCFGLGGAGTFSDGKLTTRSKDERVGRVFDLFIAHGADPDIARQKKPHLGTDGIRACTVRMKEDIERLGGRFVFGTRLCDLTVEEGRVRRIELSNGTSQEVGALLLCTGHSARDTYEMLARCGAGLRAKDFAAGLRIEHPQAFIDRTQYGSDEAAAQVGAAEYKLTWKDRQTGRGVYSFCMCPGGQVVDASTEPGRVCVNGMSHAARGSGVANAAIVATVAAGSLPGDDPLRGIAWQRRLEARAFEMGGGAAPVQRVQDFLDDRASEDEPAASVRPRGRSGNLRALFDQETGDLLARALQGFDRRMPGFVQAQAVLTGVETRTSSPVRIERTQELESEQLKGLYPLGEGAGMAGGIVSAAIDGIRGAEAVIRRYRRTENG